jgi:hypothetical protein
MARELTEIITSNKALISFCLSIGDVISKLFLRRSYSSMKPSFAFHRHSLNISFQFSSFDISSISFRGSGILIILGKRFC